MVSDNTHATATYVVEIELLEEDRGLVVIHQLIRTGPWRAVAGEKGCARYTLRRNHREKREYANTARTRRKRRGPHRDIQ